MYFHAVLLLLSFSVCLDLAYGNKTGTVTYSGPVLNRVKRQYRDCRINLDPEFDKLPIPMSMGDLPQMFQPTRLINRQSVLFIRHNRKFRFGCPPDEDGNGFIEKPEEFIANAKCVDGDIQVDLTNVNCLKDPKPVILSVIPLRAHRKFILGYSFDACTKLSLIEAYYDALTMSTKFVKATVARNTIFRPRMTNEDLFTLEGHPVHNILFMYQKPNQIAHFENLLGTGNLSDFHNLNVDHYPPFNKGHLTPKASMFNRAGELATMFMLNVAPQWPQINDGNWKQIEIRVYREAHSLQADLQVITGIMGQMTLKNENEQSLPIFLKTERSHNQVVVPKYFYKIILHRTNAQNPQDQGVVYVTLNTPLVDVNQYDSLKPCDNLLTFNVGTHRVVDEKSPPQGFSYRCGVHDFISKNNIDLEDIVIPNPIVVFGSL